MSGEGRNHVEEFVLVPLPTPSFSIFDPPQYTSYAMRPLRLWPAMRLTLQDPCLLAPCCRFWRRDITAPIMKAALNDVSTEFLTTFGIVEATYEKEV